MSRRAGEGGLRRGVLAAARAVRAANRGLATVMGGFAIAMVVVFLAVVILRYGFGIGLIWLQESAQYLHAAIFLLAAAGAIVADAHVRVDVFRARMEPAMQRRVEIAGHLLLLPFAAFLLWATIPYVAESWRIEETSVESSGLPFVYLLKTLMPVAAAQLGLQALASAALLSLGGESVAAPHHDEAL